VSMDDLLNDMPWLLTNDPEEARPVVAFMFKRLQSGSKTHNALTLGHLCFSRTALGCSQGLAAGESQSLTKRTSRLEHGLTITHRLAEVAASTSTHFATVEVRESSGSSRCS
jgi:hypothetical protein